MNKIGDEFHSVIVAISRFFFSRETKVWKKTLGFFLIILIIFLINDTFKFTFNYKINSKISQIEKIENIKKSFSNDYTMTSNLQNELDLIEEQIIKERSFLDQGNFDKALGLSTNIISKVQRKPFNFNDFLRSAVYFLSIHWLWLVFLIMTIYTFMNKKEERIVMCFVFFFFILLAYGWHQLYSYIISFLGIQTLTGALVLSLILSIISVLIITVSAMNKK